MKIISWNVAGLRACLNKGFNEFFEKENADIYCLQETKVLEEQFDYRPEGYEMYLNPADKKGYSGTLIYTKIKPLSIKYNLGVDLYDHEGRLITMEFDDFYLVNQYVPNVKRDLSRLDYRMDYEEELKKYLKELEKEKPVIVCGDFNVSHQEIDIKNAKANIGNAGFTYEERDKFTKLLESGFTDTFRHFHKTDEVYSWWSYMRGAREKNIGWRLDYFIVSNSFLENIKDSTILTEIYGSDHCPIKLELKDN